jgi:molybdate transport system substrate-binding protein
VRHDAEASKGITKARPVDGHDMIRALRQSPLSRRRGALGAILPCAVAIAVLAAERPGAAPAEPPPVVAAAADLGGALREIAARFEREHGARVELVFGSSGTLARQIHDGAPFQIFLSADEALIEELAHAKLTKDRGTRYGVGRVVLFAPHGSPLVPSRGLPALRALIAEGRMTRFAIANPEHAPYGRAAEAALRAHGLWDAVRPHLVLGENAAQAAQFATTGNAVGGILAYSLALTDALKARGTFALIQERDHPPLAQRMVLLRRAGAVATRFYTFLQEPAARTVLERYGFVVPVRP